MKNLRISTETYKIQSRRSNKNKIVVELSETQDKDYKFMFLVALSNISNIKELKELNSWHKMGERNLTNKQIDKMFDRALKYYRFLHSSTNTRLFESINFIK